MSCFNVPIILMIFNRPDLTQKVFQVLRKIRPARLYVVADGPRTSVASDAAQCAQTRAVIETIDWPCEVIKDYAESNLGCKMRVSGGITNAFKQLDKAIILEDDCIPHLDFFRYCSKLLDRYADNENIMHICGFQMLSSVGFLKTSYFFTQVPCVWGWATWKRAWDLYDVSVKEWEVKKSQVLDRLIVSQSAKQSIATVIERTREGLIDTWDYQWLACILMHEGLCAAPAANLISNCGFDPRATHTRDAANPFSCRRLSPLTFPLTHPDVLAPESRLNKRWIEKTFTKRKTFYEKIRKKLIKIKNRIILMIKGREQMNTNDSTVQRQNNL